MVMVAPPVLWAPRRLRGADGPARRGDVGRPWHRLRPARWLL